MSMHRLLSLADVDCSEVARTRKRQPKSAATDDDSGNERRDESGSGSALVADGSGARHHRWASWSGAVRSQAIKKSIISFLRLIACDSRCRNLSVVKRSRRSAHSSLKVGLERWY